MDLIRDKQEKIAKIHFEQDSRLNETKYDLKSYYFSFVFLLLIIFTN
jgi:hypothetical protein